MPISPSIAPKKRAPEKAPRFTIGADPEFPLTAVGKTTPLAAWSKTSGTKEQPVLMMEHDFGKFMCHADGVAYEVNFPAASLGSGHFRYLAEYLAQTMHEVAKASWTATPSMRYPDSILENPLASAIGCSEDFLAHAEDPKKARNPPTLQQFKDERFFAGHIHIGYPKDEDLKPHVVAKCADLYLGLPSIGYDNQGNRRKFYGVAGLFRPKPYGIEYRTLSNFWMNPSAVRHRAARIENNALNMCKMLFLQRTEMARIYNELPWAVIADTINTENASEAHSLVDTINGMLVEKGCSHYRIQRFDV